MRLNAMDDRGLLVPLDVPLEPRTDRRIDLSRHMRILVEMCPITSAYFSFLLSAILLAAL